MTEKRFTFHLDKRNPYKWNVFYGEKFVCQNDYKKGAENICDLLNDFAEENEQLKQQVDEMITIFENCGLDYHISDELNEILNR